MSGTFIAEQAGIGSRRFYARRWIQPVALALEGLIQRHSRHPEVPRDLCLGDRRIHEHRRGLAHVRFAHLGLATQHCTKSVNVGMPAI